MGGWIEIRTSEKDGPRKRQTTSKYTVLLKSSISSFSNTLKMYMYLLSSTFVFSVNYPFYLAINTC